MKTYNVIVQFEDERGTGLMATFQVAGFSNACDIKRTLAEARNISSIEIKEVPIG